MSRSSGEHPDPIFVRALLDATSGAKTEGPIVWRYGPGARAEGTVAVVAPGLIDEDGRLIITANRMRPGEPTLKYIADGGWVRRLCVNREHRPLPGTHKHRVESTGEAECYAPTDIPAVPLSPDVGPQIYRDIIEAFAAECSIALGDDIGWSEPWEE